MALPLLFKVAGVSKLVLAFLKSKFTIVKMSLTWGGLARAIGWLTGGFFAAIATTLGFSMVESMQFVVSNVQNIWNFNWLSSDEDLEQQFQAGLVALANIGGETFGSSLGWLVCGGLPASKIFVFNPELGLEVFRELKEEGLSEVTGNVAALTRLSLQSIAFAFVKDIFSNNRAVFRSGAETLGKTLFGQQNWEDYKEQVEKEGNRHLSFAEAYEFTLDRVDDQRIKAAIEGAVEGFGDACVEAGYVVSYSLDSYFSRRRVARGTKQVVMIQPDRSNDREKIYLSGGENELIEQLPQFFVDHQHLENKDLGTVLVLPPDELVRRKPTPRSLIITFRSVKSPPWRPDDVNGNYMELSVEIPDVKRSVTWSTIKQACGGASGYSAGRFKATATLDNYRTISCWGSTADAAGDRLKALGSLSDAEILFLDVVEQVREFIRLTNANLQKDVTQVYPSSCAIVSQRRIIGGNTGVPTTVGNLRRLRYRVDLWPTNEPPEADEILNEALGVPDL